MSRVGRAPIPVPPGVQINIDGSTVTVRGPKGELVRTLPHPISAALQDGVILVSRPNDSANNRALHGLCRTLVANMVQGVTQGFSKGLEIAGVGYRAQKSGEKLILSLGYSHPVEIDPPAGITFLVETPTKIQVQGINKELIGEVAAKIRAVRKPEPYKGKGVRYAGEKIQRKAGKAGGKKK
ncbi:MAG: 50S ribosomal protein L6 [Chloroflexota bacterium]|nr:MAG: 50S ribosomal protein L6 [Chloroflexota bacterium]